MSVAIPLGFILLAGVLCWFLADTKGRWPLKAVLTVFLILYGLQVWRALDSYAGWPSHEELPKRSLLISAIVREPNPAAGDPGGIYVWVQPLSLPDPDPFEFRPVSGEPRAYRLPYTRSLHEGMSQAMQAKKEDGRPILLERDGLQGGGEGEGGENGNRRTYGEDDGGGLRLRDLPPPSLPPKDPQPAH